MPKGNLKFKELDVRRAIRGVSKEGIHVDRVEIDREGKIVIVAAKADENNGNDLDKRIKDRAY